MYIKESGIQIMIKNLKEIVFAGIVTIFCVIFLIACGELDIEKKAESFDVCEAIKDFDFSVQEYQINTILYTAGVEQEFKNAFYEAISNRVPMEYTEDGAIYFREWFKGVAYESDSEFLEGLRKSKYRFIDMDGDGLPELAMQLGWEICILQYDMEEKRVKGYFGPAEGWVLLGSDRLGIHDTGSPDLERNEYRFLGGRNGKKQIFYFERDTMYELLCTVTASGKIEGGAVVSEEKWVELTLRFFDSMKYPVEFFSFEETFGEVSDGQLASARDVENAQRAFSEFLAGEKNAGNIAVKDIVESADGETKYLIFDVSGDGVPELHIQTNKTYYIFSYQQDKLFVWFKENDRYGSNGHYDVLESGEVVRSIFQGDREYYSYWRIQPSSEVMVDFSFGRVDTNGDGIYDRTDIYEFDMRTMEERYAGLESEQNITMEEWLDMLKDYLYIDENGRVQLLGRLEWADL